MSAGPVLQIQDIHKSFATANRSVDVLAGISLGMDRGESLAVMGPSGSGKSTLLHLVGTLDRPSTGGIRINGKDPFALKEPELARFRNEVIGFVFQDHHLLPQYSVLENVLMPSLAFKRGNLESRARELLDRVGLAHRLDHRPAELSGGERQRVAIARALINQPELLLCDEPTGNLDQRTAETVADLLFELHRQENNLLIVVTHGPALAARCGRVFELLNGRFAEAAGLTS